MSFDEAAVEVIARITHEANRAWCLSHGDASQVAWDGAPQWQRDSALDGVRCALGGASPRELHANWCAVKQRDGWEYGPVKDPDHKRHPCLVAYDLLPEHQRLKDSLFAAVVGALSETARVKTTVASSEPGS